VQFILALNTMSGIVAVSLCRLTMSFFFFFDCWQLVWLRGNGQSSCYASQTALRWVSELRLGSWPFRDVVGRCISGDVQYILCSIVLALAVGGGALCDRRACKIVLLRIHLRILAGGKYDHVVTIGRFENLRLPDKAYHAFPYSMR